MLVRLVSICWLSGYVWAMWKRPRTVIILVYQKTLDIGHWYLFSSRVFIHSLLLISDYARASLCLLAEARPISFFLFVFFFCSALLLCLSSFSLLSVCIFFTPRWEPQVVFLYGCFLCFFFLFLFSSKHCCLMMICFYLFTV